jgi:hypothetical protein
VLSLAGDICPACVAQQGLCQRHEKGVLPQLAQPFWHKLVGQDRRYEEQRVLADMSPEARLVYERKQRKAKRRQYAAHGPAAFVASLRLDQRKAEIRETLMREHETYAHIAALMDEPPPRAA